MKKVESTITCYNCRKIMKGLLLADAVGTIIFIDKEGEERKCLYLDLNEVSASCSNCQRGIELEKYIKKGFLFSVNEEIEDEWQLFNSYELLESFVIKYCDSDIDLDYEINDKSINVSFNIIDKEIIFNINL
jgi:hypothetical protein